MDETGARTPGVASARRVLEILVMFAEKRPDLTVDEIASGVKISVPSAYRFLSLLRELALVEENARGTYALSPRAFALARSAEQGWSLPVTLIRPLVERLSAQTGEAALAIRRLGDFATCVEMSQSEHTVLLSFVPGRTMSLHRGAGPKVLLAGMGEQWARRYFDRLEPRPPSSESSRVLSELPDITSQGWAKSSSEVDRDTWAVAAPIYAANEVVAALTVAGPQFRIDADRAARIFEQVLSGAAEVTRSLKKYGENAASQRP